MSVPEVVATKNVVTKPVPQEGTRDDGYTALMHHVVQFFYVRDKSAILYVGFAAESSTESPYALLAAQYNVRPGARSLHVPFGHHIPALVKSLYETLPKGR